MAVDKRRIEEGGTERLGQTVHREQPRVREQPAQSPDQIDRQRTARIGQAAQFRSGFLRPVKLCELHPQRRHGGQCGHAIPLHRLCHIARGQIVERNHAAPGVPGGKQLVLAIVERQRQHCQSDIVGCHPEVTRNAIGPQPYVGMAQHHALGLAGRAAGIKDRGQFVRIGGTWRQRIGAARLLDRLALTDDAAMARNIAGLEPVQPRRRADQQAGTAVGQDVRHLGMLQQRIDRHMDQSGPCRGQRHQAGQLALGGPGRNPCSGLGHLAFKPSRQPGDTIP